MKKTIYIVIEGGYMSEVIGIPKGYEYTTVDFDNLHVGQCPACGNDFDDDEDEACEACGFSLVAFEEVRNAKTE